MYLNVVLHTVITVRYSKQRYKCRTLNEHFIFALFTVPYVGILTSHNLHVPTVCVCVCS